MKYTDQDIINKFSSVDLDPKGKKQAEIYRKVTVRSTSQKVVFTLGAALGAAILAAVVFVPEYMHRNDKFDMAVHIEESNALQAPRTIPSAASAEVSPSLGFANPLDFVVPSTGYSDASVAYSAPDTYGIEEEGSYATSSSQTGSYDEEDDESYIRYEENSFKLVKTDPLSTFSADVDTASYGIMKREIGLGRFPALDSIRIEEFLNYFKYSYAAPKKGEPFSADVQYTDCPWRAETRLVRVAIKAKDIEQAKAPKSNIVFLIDVSGSMLGRNRLDLIQKSFRMLINNLRPTDIVSIVTYADGTHIVLEGEPLKNKTEIIQAVDALYAGGATAGSDGLKLAYEIAQKHFIKGGNNRVILATDGDFNVGPSSKEEMEDQIVKARDNGVFLSVFGFGMGNYKDSLVQTLADKGNGNYAYVNNFMEAKKVFGTEFLGKLFTVAKDVKFQVEFNPEKIASYRLVGYEKRKLDNEDFNDDTKDAGEVGAGQSVTVLYEVIPAGVKSSMMPAGSDLKYSARKGNDSDEILTVRIRYKEPDGDTSKLIELPVTEEAYVPFAQASDDVRFASALAAFGQTLKDSKFKGNITMDEVIKIAKAAKGVDDNGDRAEFVKIADIANMLLAQGKAASKQMEDY